LDARLFKGSKGELERVREGHLVFVPPTVPRQWEYDQGLVEVLAEAQLEIGRLSALGQMVPNPALLVAPYVRREAVLSSRIEGTRASLSDIFLDEAELLSAPRDAADVLEVRNYVRALDQGLQEIRSRRRLDLDLLKGLHATLLGGVRGGNKSPGEFRTTQNWIGPPGSTPLDAPYVPPDPTAMRKRLKDFEGFLAEPPSMPPLLQDALLHYQFEAIHPFRDGNGRIGRLLIILFLVDRGILSAPLLYLSAYFESHQREYYEALLRVSMEGAYADWCHFFLEGVIAQSRDAVDRARKLVALRETNRQSLLSKNATAVALAVLDRLFENPFVSISGVAKALGVTFPTAQKAIERHLVPAGILVEETGHTRSRRYAAREILALLEG